MNQSSDISRACNIKFPIETGDQCICHKCIEENQIKAYEGSPFLLSSSIMIVCPECGNKRCPRASDYNLECSGSNAIGQEGSIYK